MDFVIRFSDLFRRTQGALGPTGQYSLPSLLSRGENYFYHYDYFLPSCIHVSLSHDNSLDCNSVRREDHTEVTAAPHIKSTRSSGTRH